MMFFIIVVLFMVFYTQIRPKIILAPTLTHFSARPSIAARKELRHISLINKVRAKIDAYNNASTSLIQCNLAQQAYKSKLQNMRASFERIQRYKKGTRLKIT